MSHQETNFERPEVELGAVSKAFRIPFIWKLLVSVGAIGLISFCALYVSNYLGSPSVYASPSDLDLSSIFLFAVSAFFIAWMPWHALGVRITKIGGIEFKEIVAEQASEHAEEISYLQDRIEVLEANLRQLNGVTGIIESFEEPNLRKLLISFLTKYKEWAFSPSRIRAWGAQQQGFSDLAKYDHPFIRGTLQKLVSEGTLETRVSSKGNTLYRVPLY